MSKDNAKAIADLISQYSEDHFSKALEIGCGDGRITSLINGCFDMVVAMDPDHDCLRRASLKNPENACFYAGSGESLPFGCDAFDLVVFTMSLHHQDSLAALKDACRVAKRDGLVLVIEPSTSSDFERLCYAFHNEEQDLINARRALTNGGFPIASDQSVETHWTFDDFNDLEKWLLNFYASTEDNDRIEAVRRFLGKKAERKPLTISDELRVTTIRKN